LGALFGSSNQNIRLRSEADRIPVVKSHLRGQKNDRQDAAGDLRTRPSAEMRLVPHKSIHPQDLHRCCIESEARSICRQFPMLLEERESGTLRSAPDHDVCKNLNRAESTLRPQTRGIGMQMTARRVALSVEMITGCMGDRGQVFFRSYCLSDECYRRVNVPTGRPGIVFEAKRRRRQSGDGT
jgi:hypothetical protein